MPDINFFDHTDMDETNWLQVGDVLDNFLLLEGTCEDLNALHEPLFLDVVVDTINPPDGSTETSLLQVESSPSPDVSDGKLLPFPCLKCPKSFQFRSRLQRHMTTHQVLIRDVGRSENPGVPVVIRWAHYHPPWLK